MNDWLAIVSPFGGLALAVVLGLLIGIERGWSQRLEADGLRVAGIRTFTLLGLTGGLAGEAASLVSPVLAAVIVGVAGVALLIGYRQSAARGEVSATTTIVGVLTLGIGVFAATGHGMMASLVAAIATVILSLRRQLHKWVGELTEPELHAIARFGLISLAILPLLPNQPLGPFEAWNPRQIWLVVVLVSGLSLVGYAVSKRLGATRGILAMAVAGSLVSSTAVTAAMAARIRNGEGRARTLVAAIAIASTVMFLRVVVLVSLLAPEALLALTFVAGPAIVVGAAYAAWAIWGDGALTDTSPPSLRNPFDLGPALLLAAFVMAVSLVGRWALDRFGDAGLVTVLGISGMLDVDSAVITASGLPPGSLDGVTAGLVFAAPLIMNSLVKAGLTIAIAGGRAGWGAAVPLLLTVAAGLAGASILPLFLAL